MTYDAQTNLGQHVMSNFAFTSNQRYTNDSSLLIDSFDVLLYDVKLIPALCQTKHNFKCSNRRVVDTSIVKQVFIKSISELCFFYIVHTNYKIFVY